MPDDKRKLPTTAAPGIVTLRVPDAGASRNIVPFLQGPGTNMLATVSTTSRRSTVKVDPITAEGQLSAGIGESEMTVFFSNYTTLDGYKVSTNKLLDIIIIRFSAQNGFRQDTNALRTEVIIPLKEYLKLLGKDPESKSQMDILRRTVKKDLCTLDSISLEWTERSGRATRDYMRMRLLTRQGIVNGNIIVNLSPELAAYLNQSYVMGYSLKLLSTNERFPSAYHIGRKMLQTLNFARKKDPGTDEAVISVEKLLKACPDLPDPDTVTQRHHYRDIIQPLENALNALCDINFCRWEYVNAGSRPLTPDQLKERDYKTIIQRFIRFTIISSQEN